MNGKFKRLSAIVVAAAVAMSFCSFALTGCKDGGEPDPNPIVQEKKITKIAVTTRPRLKYIVGERFDKTGMVVTATYDDGTTEEVTDYTIDKTEPLTVKDNSVTVMYKGKLAYIPIVVGIELYEQLTIHRRGGSARLFKLRQFERRGHTAFSGSG